MSPQRTIAIASVVAIAFAACTYRPDPGPDDGRPTGAAQERRGGSLIVAVADDAGLLDPQIASQPGAFGLIRATQRGLTAFPPSATGADEGDAARANADPAPDLAESAPTVSADGLEYTFRLRDGVAFGPPASRALAASDVKAGLERAIRLPASPLRPYLRVIDGAADFAAGRSPSVAGITTPDERTVVIRLSRPANDLPWMLAHPAASAVPEGLSDAIAPAELAASGPYRIDRVAPGREIRLVRNPAWKGASDPIRRAYVDSIVVRVGPAAGADLTGDEIPLDPKAPAVVVDGGCLLYLFVAPIGSFARPEARSAVSLAIDRAALIREAAADAASLAEAAPAAAILPPAIAGAEDRPVTPADAAEARRRLGGAVRVALGRETTGPDAAEDAALAGPLTRMLAAAGITAVPLTVAAPGSIYQRYEAGGVPMGIARWCPDWPGRGARTMIGALAGTGGAANYARSGDATLDALLDTALSERVPARIAPATKAAADRALAVATVVPLAFFPERVQVSDRVQGFASSALFVRGDPANVWLSRPEPSPAPGGGAPSIAVRYNFPVPASNGGVCC